MFVSYQHGPLGGKIIPLMRKRHWFLCEEEWNGLYNGVQKWEHSLQFPAMVPLHPLAVTFPLHGGGWGYMRSRAAGPHKCCSEKTGN